MAVALLLRVDDGGSGDHRVYLTSNWDAPFGIVLVADRLSALMLVLVGVVALGAALYASAGWYRAGTYFHPLFQIQLMGLNGAFLTGDLFNLFVFFEVMLAASYGLQLHGSGRVRVRAGLHYIAVNLLASSLFLVGLAVLYGVLGTPVDGRRRRQGAAGGGRRSRPAARGRGDARDGVPRQGRDLAAQLLAGAGLYRDEHRRWRRCSR